MILLDGGNGFAETSIVTQQYGDSRVSYRIGASTSTVSPSISSHWNSYYLGIDESNDGELNVSYTRYLTIPSQETAVIDTPAETTVASVITLQEVSAVNSTLNQTAIEVSVTAPVGSGPYIDNYKGSKIYARVTTGDSWYDFGIVGSIGELSFLVPADGAVWEVKAHAVSITDVESEDYISDTITVTTQLETVIGTGNAIVTSPTPDVDGGVTLDEAGIVAYDGTGTAKVTIDAATGVITAVDGNFSGTVSADAGDIGNWSITSTSLETGTAASHMELNPTTGIWMGADAIGNAPFSVTNAGVLTATDAVLSGSITANTGAIGGWDINATSIESPNNRVILDAANNRMQVQDAAGTNYTDGITGVDSVLGTVFRLPTDGTTPTFVADSMDFAEVSNISVNAIVQIERNTYDVQDGTLEFSTDLAGIYEIYVEAFPELPIIFKVVALL